MRRRRVLNKFASYSAKLRWIFAMKNPLFSVEQESSQAQHLDPVPHESLRSVTGVAIACEALTLLRISTNFSRSFPSLNNSFPPHFQPLSTSSTIYLSLLHPNPTLSANEEKDAGAHTSFPVRPLEWNGPVPWTNADRKSIRRYMGESVPQLEATRREQTRCERQEAS